MFIHTQEQFCETEREKRIVRPPSTAATGAPASSHHHFFLSPLFFFLFTHPHLPNPFLPLLSSLQRFLSLWLFHQSSHFASYPTILRAKSWINAPLIFLSMNISMDQTAACTALPRKLHTHTHTYAHTHTYTHTCTKSACCQRDPRFHHCSKKKGQAGCCGQKEKQQVKTPIEIKEGGFDKKRGASQRERVTERVGN